MALLQMSPTIRLALGWSDVDEGVWDEVIEVEKVGIKKRLRGDEDKNGDLTTNTVRGVAKSVAEDLQKGKSVLIRDRDHPTDKAAKIYCRCLIEMGWYPASAVQYFNNAIPEVLSKSTVSWLVGERQGGVGV